MKQLSARDAEYIDSDNEHANSNVTLVHIYDQTTAPGGLVRFKQILSHIESRLDRLPFLRRKVVRVPLNLDYPYWVEDDNFNLEHHVRHIALPKPGDWRQFCIQSARIHARPLDRNRPLWEMYVIEGLDSFLDLPVGSFAILFRIHHAVVDVEQGNEITRVLHDLAPHTPPPPPIAPWYPEDAPGDLALLWRASWNLPWWPQRAWRSFSGGMRALGSTLHAVVSELRGAALPFPATRFNSEVSSQRVFDTRRFALEDFRRIRAVVPKATVHDVVMAVCAGALRRYLEQHDELPQDPLVAAVPLAVQGAPAHAVSPHFAWVRQTLGTHLEDPVERLAFIQSHAAQDNARHQALSARTLTSMAEQLPSMALASTSKMLRWASDTQGAWAPLANCAIANIPGTSEPLYLQGAKLTYLSAIMPVYDGMGLVFSVTGYANTIVVSFTACAEQVGDPQALSQCVRDSFQEYLALVALTPAPVAVRAPRSRKAKGVAARAPTRALGGVAVVPPLH